jgi:type II secretion system (T2SS) protein E
MQIMGGMQENGFSGGPRRLGEILALEPEQLSTALAHAQARGQRLGSVLIKLGYAVSDRVALALAAQHGVEAALEAELQAARSERQLLGAIQAWRLLALPLGRDAGGTLSVAVADPGDPAVLDGVRACVGNRVRFRVAAEATLRRHLERLYGPPTTRVVPAADRGRLTPAPPLPHAPDLSDFPDNAPDNAATAPFASDPAPGPALPLAAAGDPISLVAAVRPTPTLALWQFALRWRLLLIGLFFIPAILFIVTFARKALDAPDTTAIPAGRFETAGSRLAVDIPDPGWVHLPDNDLASRDGSETFHATWLQRGGTPREPALGALLVRWSAPDLVADFDPGKLRRWVRLIGDRMAEKKKEGAIRIGDLECELTRDRPEHVGICRGPAHRYASYDLVAWMWHSGADEVAAVLFFSQDSAVYVEEEIDTMMRSIEPI